MRPFAFAWARFVAYVGSTYLTPSDAFMNANRLPAAATSGQLITPCQWLTSMPSMKPDVSGGGGTSIAIGRHRPRAAYSALTP